MSLLVVWLIWVCVPVRVHSGAASVLPFAPETDSPMCATAKPRFIAPWNFRGFVCSEVLLLLNCGLPPLPSPHSIW